MNELVGDEFYWFLRTTEEELFQYEDTFAKFSVKGRKCLHDIIERITCCQWYDFYLLYKKNVLEMTVQEWKEVTSQDQYVKFSFFTYIQVKNDPSIRSFKNSFINKKHPIGQQIKFKALNGNDASTTLLYLVRNLLAYDDNFPMYQELLYRLGAMSSIHLFLKLPRYAFLMVEHPDLPYNGLWGETWLAKATPEIYSLMDNLESFYWYLKSILSVLELSSMTLDEWDECTSRESFQEFSNMKVYKIDKDAILKCFQVHDTYTQLLEQDDESVSDYGESKPKSPLDNEEPLIESSSNDNNTMCSFSCHSGLPHVDLAPVPLVDHGEVTQSIHDRKENYTKDLNENILQDKNEEIKDAESTRKDAKGTMIEKK
jgi:hypothetical protein